MEAPEAASFLHSAQPLCGPHFRAWKRLAVVLSIIAMNQFVLSVVASTVFASSLLAADPPPPGTPAAGGERPRRQGRPPTEHSHGRDAALAETGKMKVADGLAVTLFACEPMVVNPCGMDIDERGRVWIAEGANYRLTMHTNWGVIRPGGD